MSTKRSGITIGRDGTVSVELEAGQGDVQVGQIQVARFVNPSGLMPMGRNLLEETNASGDVLVGVPGEAGNGFLMQGTLEASNVNVVEEMVSMIETQRAMKLIQKL